MEETQVLERKIQGEGEISACEDLSEREECKQAYAPHELGKRGEVAAKRFLKRRGFEILDCNWTCFAGEADIVALEEDTLCFIEVKTRANARKGFPSEAVDEHKRARYERIAACYLKDHDLTDMRVRFDIIAILVLGENRAFLRHHINAFGSM